MASFEKGTKRQCQSCEMKFYDLGRDPIICPGCGEEFVIASTPTTKVKEEKVEPVVKPIVETDDIVIDPDTISLEEAEEDIVEDIPDVDDVEVEVDDDVNADQQDTFLEVDDDDAKIDLGVPTNTRDE